jgi:hypothetical protein
MTPKWLPILRDLVLLAVGVVGIMHQEFSGQESPILLAVYTTLLGIPGAANVLAIIKTQVGGSGQSSSLPPASSAASSPLSKPSGSE